MRVWFPDGYTEAHRTAERQSDLHHELISAGLKVDVGERPSARYLPELVFCGSLYRADAVRAYTPRGVPVIHYNWDLYPWVVGNRPEMGWDAYLDDLRRATRILVPSTPVAARTWEMVRRHSHRVLAPVKVWEFDRLRTPDTKPYAVDVMRDYEWDPGFLRATHACDRLGLRLVRTKTQTDWDEFRWLVGNADVLLCGVDEASTGGLTLLEGYAHGVPVVVPAAKYNGAQEYFYGRAHYFLPEDGPDGMARAIAAALERNWSPGHAARCRKWVEREHSDRRFATDLAREFQKCLGR